MSIVNILKKNAETAAAALEAAKEAHLEVEKFLSTTEGAKLDRRTQDRMLAAARGAYNHARQADLEAYDALFAFQHPGN